MEKRETIAQINRCLDIARNYDEPWSFVVFEKLLERLLTDFSDSEPVEIKSDRWSKAKPDIRKLGEIIGVDTKQLLELYGFDDDAPVLKQYDLQAKTQTEKAREVSGLYLLACTVAYGMECVPIQDLVSVAKEWDAYDPSNFTAKHIGGCDWFHRVDKQVKLLLPARQEIALIVKRILGVDVS